MKVFEINSVPYGSTGRIMFQIAELVKLHGGEAVTACSYTKPREIELPSNFYQIGGIIGKFIHMKLSNVTGRQGCYSKHSTKKLIEKIRNENPDIIHIHNIHAWFLNIPMFFSFLKEYNRPVVWTLHDCWAFTGHCAYYTLKGCNKWQTGCCECPSYKEYPRSFVDDSMFQYRLKREYFTLLNKLTIVTPSQWLADEVKKSFLSKYDIKVINNGIDISVFKPTNSQFRNKYGIQDKIVLLGVSFDWGERKGLQFFKRLSQDLGRNYQLILVGVSSEQKNELPDNIITIATTQNQIELAEIYTTADALVNPTLEDNFPTVNMEALACGTPVLTFATGGSPEIIDKSCGWVIKRGDYKALITTVKNIRNKTEEMIANCVNKSKEYNRNDKNMEYIKLFNSLVEDR